MVRKIASQVHQQVSRLMRGKYITKEPAWYQAVLEYPPITLPPKAPPARGPADATGSSSSKPYTNRPLPVHYIEDDLRRQFFRDHPFEAFRPTSLVENDVIEPPHTVTGKEWTRLRQRGRNPIPEDAVQYAVNLHQHHDMSLSDAYQTAVAQFHALRSEHHIATNVAAMEAQDLGSTFGPSEIEANYAAETNNLSSWERKKELDEGAIAARKRWRAVVDKVHGVNQWTKGEEYTRLWRESIRPNYMPSLTTPVQSVS